MFVDAVCEQRGVSGGRWRDLFVILGVVLLLCRREVIGRQCVADRQCWSLPSLSFLRCFLLPHLDK